jgi:hypothetical protein
VTSKTLLAWYQVPCRTAQNKQPNTITEPAVFPAATDMVETTFRKKFTQQVRNVRPSNNTIPRRIADISEDLKEQLTDKSRIRGF